jgi:hypothetical protein
LQGEEEAPVDHDPGFHSTDTSLLREGVGEERRIGAREEGAKKRHERGRERGTEGGRDIRNTALESGVGKVGVSTWAMQAVDAHYCFSL